jgi:hypothetical protein
MMPTPTPTAIAAIATGDTGQTGIFGLDIGIVIGLVIVVLTVVGYLLVAADALQRGAKLWRRILSWLGRARESSSERTKQDDWTEMAKMFSRERTASAAAWQTGAGATERLAATVQDMHTTIKQKDATIQKLNATIQNLEARIRERDATIEQLRAIMEGRPNAPDGTLKPARPSPEQRGAESAEEKP